MRCGGKAIYKEPDHLILSESTEITSGNRSTSCTVNDTSCRDNKPAGPSTWCT